MPFFSRGAVQLYYQLVGQGPPVVFTGGWTMSCEYWRPLVEELQPRYRCLLYDPRGFGRSLPLSAEAEVEIEDHAEDLHELIEGLRLRDVHLVGHGLGAWISIMCARRHPQDLLTITAIAPEREQEESEAEMPSLWKQASLLLKDLASLPLLRNLVAWRYRRAPEPFRTRLCEDFATADRRAAFHLLASCMGVENRKKLDRAISEVHAPVLLARGSEDRLCPPEAFRNYFELIRSGKMATVRGCGHFPMLEFTKEFAALLGGFFDKHDRRPLQPALSGYKD